MHLLSRKDLAIHTLAYPFTFQRLNSMTVKITRSFFYLAMPAANATNISVGQFENL